MKFLEEQRLGEPVLRSTISQESLKIPFQKADFLVYAMLRSRFVMATHVARSASLKSPPN
eukprot:3703407-Amphidinium_carterae.1